MNREPLIVCGLTPFAGMVAHYFETYSGHEVVAFAAHARFVREPEFEGRPVVPIEQLAGRFSTAEVRFFAAIEYKWLNSARAKVVEEMKNFGYRAAAFIHPASTVCPTAQVGEHCLVMEGATIGYRSVIGGNNILHPQVHIGHQAEIGSHNYFCAGALIDRGSIVGNHCYLGPGTLVASEGKMGNWCYTRPRQEIIAPVSSGTTFNPCLRAPGYVIDRRRPPSPIAPAPAA